jgi:hypothetical protein
MMSLFCIKWRALILLLVISLLKGGINTMKTFYLPLITTLSLFLFAHGVQSQCHIAFIDSNQELGDSDSLAVSLGDLDGDGDLDAFVVNWIDPDRIWLNDGHGTFTAGQVINDSDMGGGSMSREVSLGDLDGDGDLDAVVVKAEYNEFISRSHRVWLNNGNGTFTEANHLDVGPIIGAEFSRDIVLGDLDSDGDLDAIAASKLGSSSVALNNGKGKFTHHQYIYHGKGSTGVSLGDVNGDGDLDAFFALTVMDKQLSPSSGKPNQVWLNDGKGNFTDSGQRLGDSISYGVSLGDLDGDGNLDAFVNDRITSGIWLNDGHSNFIDSGQVLHMWASQLYARTFSLSDLDGDGDLDIFIIKNVPSSGTVRSDKYDKIWLNDGHGIFSTDSRLAIDYLKKDHAVSLLNTYQFELNYPHQKNG